MNLLRMEPRRQARVCFEQLRHYLVHEVGRYHPFLRRRYAEAAVSVASVRTPADLARLPLIEKADLRGRSTGFILQPARPGAADAVTEAVSPAKAARLLAQAVFNLPRDPANTFRRMGLAERIKRRALLEYYPVHFHVSAGTTGEPVLMAYTHYDLTHVVPILACGSFCRADRPEPGGVLLEFEDRCFNAFPGAPHLAFFQTVFTKFGAGISGFDSCGGKVMPTERQIEVFSRGRFAGIAAVPSYLLYWLAHARRRIDAGEVEPFTAMKGCSVGAEPLTDELREKLRAAALACGAPAGFRIVETYGSTEFRWAFMECREGVGIHVNPQFHWLETIDPDTHEPVGPDEPGVLVVTHVGWRGTVLVRYNTGDRVAGLARVRCPHCGFTFWRIRGPIRRHAMDQFKIAGTKIDIDSLLAAVRGVPGARDVQVRVEPPAGPMEHERLTCRVLTDAGAEPLREAVARAVREQFEVHCTVELETDGDRFERSLFARTGIKADHFRDLRAEPGTAAAGSAAAGGGGRP